MKKIAKVSNGFRTAIIGGALAALVAVPAQAADLGGLKDTSSEGRKLELSANVALTTDYVFRGMSQTGENPAIQGGFDATYGMFYAGVWGSNLDFGGGADCGLTFGDCANIELDLYAGITPSFRGLDFDLGFIYYTYPDAYDPGAELNFWEVKAGVSGKPIDRLNLGFTVFYSPEYTGEVGKNWVFEWKGELSLPKIGGRFDPTLSALVGYQDGDDTTGVDYTYWNVGLSLGFHEKFTLDVRYWDTDIDGCAALTLFQCDERVVGTLSASF